MWVGKMYTCVDLTKVRIYMKVLFVVFAKLNIVCREKWNIN